MNMIGLLTRLGCNDSAGNKAADKDEVKDSAYWADSVDMVDLHGCHP